LSERPKVGDFVKRHWREYVELTEDGIWTMVQHVADPRP
jgi:hypothetical protein